MRFFSAYIFCVLFCVACSSKQPKYTKLEGYTQGTTLAITYKDSLGRDLSSELDSILKQFDRTLSLYNDSSQLSQWNRGERVRVNEWFAQCVRLSKEVHTASEGKFDPTLRSLIAAYGFGKGSSKERMELSNTQKDSLLEFVGLEMISLRGDSLLRRDKRVTLDFNAIAQGLSVDIISGWLESKCGIENYLVEIGGEIYAKGKNPKGEDWKIGIDKPLKGNNAPGEDLQTIVSISGRGMATSGNYRKFIDTPAGEMITHTIDPHTGKSVRSNLLSATIIAPNAALADAYATSCMVGGLEWSKDFLSSSNDFSGVLIYSSTDGKLETFSEGI